MAAEAQTSNRLDNIPELLRARPQWVCWRYEERDGKPTKVPYDPETGEKASSTAPRTWGTFGKALRAVEGGGYAGIGYVLTEDDPFTGFDFDKVRDPRTGKIEPEARELIDRLDSYTEASPSQRGVRVIVRAEKLGPRCRTGKIELYDEGRFLTLTGDVLEGRDTIRDRQQVVNAIYQELFGDDGVRGGQVVYDGPRSPELTDEQVLAKAERAANGEKFRRLFHEGNIRDYGSRSEADSALLWILRFWTQDPEQLERLFNRSKLNRPKWRKRPDYRKRTLGGALSGEFDVWRGRPELTDLGNARRFVERHGGNVRYIRELGWLVWDGRRWVRDKTNEVMRCAKETARSIYGEASEVKDDGQSMALAAHAIKTQSADRLQKMVKLAESEPEIAIAHEALDVNPWLLNVLNGTIDLRTGQLRPHQREDLITRLAPVSCDPKAHLPLWDKFLGESMEGPHKDELVAFLRRVAGSCATGDTSDEKLFMLIGPTRSGKGTFTDAIAAALGDYAAVADVETFIKRTHTGQVRSDLARLAGARAVFTSEADEGRHLAEGLVKRVSGGDKLTVAFKFKDEFEFKPQFKLWIAANHPPVVNDEDAAMWERILRIPFSHTVPADRLDPNVKKALTDPEVAGPAVLAWIVRGCLEWQEQGLNPPPVVMEATQRYKMEMDPLRGFIEDCCELDAGEFTPSAALREAYHAWHKLNGDGRALSRNEFADRLRRRGCESGQDKTGKVRGWYGIKLLDEFVRVSY